ncbi:MAG: hypothetical protein RJB13_871 [Pseudomonadota bacterium]
MSTQSTCCNAVRFVLVCVAFVVCAAFASVGRADVEVIWPESSPEWGLLLNPGAQRQPDEYRQLARRIQEESPVALAVGIASYVGNWPEPFQMTAALRHFKAVVRAKSDESIADERFLIGGHSMAGIILQELPAHEKLGGVLLMGAYPAHDILRLGSGLRRAEIPTLVLAGEWDGLTRITRVLDTVLECEGVVAGSPDAKRCSMQRVVVLPGVNHSDFANGAWQAGDLESELDLATAHTEIARAVGGFWSEVLLMTPHSDFHAQYQPQWRSLVADTRTWAKAWDKVTQLDETACLMAQKKLLPQQPSSVSWEVVVRMVESVPGFVFAKPTIEQLGVDRFRVQAVQTQDRPFNPLDLSIKSRAFTRLSCKLKSAEALRQRAKALAAHDTHELNSCGSINEEVYQEVRRLLPAELTTRLERRGLALRFGHDVQMTSGPRWIAAKPVRSIDTTSREAVVTLPRLQTETSAPLQLDGMHYCQFVPPTQLAEWVFFDSFKQLSGER